MTAQEGCANCCKKFDLIIREVFINTSPQEKEKNWTSVKLSQILSSVYKLDLKGQDIALCTKCAVMLQNLYQHYQNFNKIQQPESHLADITRQQQRFSHEAKVQMSRPLPPQRSISSISIDIDLPVKIKDDLQNDQVMAVNCDDVTNMKAVDPIVHFDLEEEPDVGSPEVDPLAINEEEEPEIQILDDFYNCPLCQAHLLTQSDLTHHLSVQHVTKSSPATCPICKNKLSSFSDLKRHLELHAENDKNPSSGTPKHTATTQKKKDSRTWGRLLTCSSCPFKTKSKGDIIRHTLGQHKTQQSKRKSNTKTAKGPFICEICKKECGQKSSLEIHVRSHTGEKPYKCTRCPYASTTGGNLQIHMRVHTGERPYECLVQGCNYFGATSGSLKRHGEIHMKDKKYQCPSCPKKYALIVSYRAHLKKHENAKSFDCPHCSYSSRHNGNLKIHLKKHGKRKSI